MKILFVCHEYPPNTHGGIGSFTKLLAEKLVQKGISVCVIGYGPDQHSTKNNENGVNVFRLATPKEKRNKYVRSINAFKERWVFHRELRKYIDQYKPDIIETYEWSGPVLYRYKYTKLVVRLHGGNTANNDYMGIKRSRIISYFERRTISKANHIISVSNHIAEITQKSLGLNFKYQTIYSGVDTSLFCPQNVDRNIAKIVLVGRMHPYKGFEQLFASLNRVFESNSDVFLDIVCTINQDYMKRLLTMVNSEYHNRIHFIGRIPNQELNLIYSSANLTVLPSLSEAFPLIPLESMACETPVIMSDRFSSREIIDENSDGFLVNVLDPKEFADRIIGILKNQEEIEGMRANARKKILTKFNIEEIIEQNIRFYESILSND